MAHRMWTVEQGDRCHVITLDHGHWSGRRRIRVDGELVHESQVLFELGRTCHRFQVDQRPFAVVVRTNGATYGYELVRDEPGPPRSTEPAPASFREGSGDEMVPVLVGTVSPAREPVAGTLPAAEPPALAGAAAYAPVVILALIAALAGTALDFPDAGALGSALVVGLAGVRVGRHRGERAGGETLFSLIGGLLGAALGLGLGAGVFSLLLVAILALLLLAPLPGVVSD
jgi:Fas apoptotic inhibitory molecule (FAIM1)